MTETDRYVKIIVQDQGEGFKWQEIIGKNLDPESLDERGRGIYLAKMSSDFLSYNLTFTVLKMQKARSR